ncbi:hypothetical protein ACFL1H_00455 [Nanoarchaeota archaeon]
MEELNRYEAVNNEGFIAYTMLECPGNVYNTFNQDSGLEILCWESNRGDGSGESRKKPSNNSRNNYRRPTGESRKKQKKSDGESRKRRSIFRKSSGESNSPFSGGESNW